MKKVDFIKNEYLGLIPKATEEKYGLLSLFIGTYAFTEIIEIIEDLAALHKGTKTFDEIQDPNGYWTFAEGEGYLEADKDTAHFISWNESNESFDMPLIELIGYMKEWRKIRKV